MWQMRSLLTKLSTFAKWSMFLGYLASLVLLLAIGIFVNSDVL